MATTKTPVAPKPFTVKSTGTKSGTGFYVITVLVKENDIFKRGARATKDSELFAFIQDHLEDDFDKAYDKWAIKVMKLTDEQFEIAYESA